MYKEILTFLNIRSDFACRQYPVFLCSKYFFIYTSIVHIYFSIITFFFSFFLQQIYFSKSDLFCYLLGKCSYRIKHKIIIFEEKKSRTFLWFWLIFMEICLDLADFLLPGSEAVSWKGIRTRLNKMKWIKSDPDPQHCHKR